MAHRSTFSVSALVGATALTLLGCAGSIDDDGMTRPGAGGVAGPMGAIRPMETAGTGGGPVAPPPPGSAAAGPMPLRRLTAAEYARTVRDLLRLPNVPTLILPPDSEGSHGFAEPGLTSDVDVRSFMESAELLAGAATTNLMALLGCSLDTNEAACIKSFVEKFGTRVYRRPLSPGEVAAHVSFYESRRATEDRPQAVRTLVQAFLQSPFFLYHWEDGLTLRPASGGVRKLSPHQLASRLSYFFWKTMPDDSLFQAASSGALDTATGVAQQADRLMKDPRFRETAAMFHDGWLGLGRVDSLMRTPSTWASGVPLAVQKEARKFVEHVLLDADGRIDTLLTARFSFVDRYSARIYGLPTITRVEPEKTDLSAHPRWGLLTQPAMLALGSFGHEPSPIYRGLFVRTKLMCQPLGDPPPEIPELPSPAAGLSIRDRHVQHVKSPQCSGCHRLIDDIGFAFGNYDQIGRHRDTEDGKPIDVSGTLRGVDGKDHGFDGAEALINVLAKSPEVQRCVARQWTRFALGRAEKDGDEPFIESALTASRAANGDLRAYIKALASSPAFTHRAVAQGEPQ